MPCRAQSAWQGFCFDFLLHSSSVRKLESCRDEPAPEHLRDRCEVFIADCTSRNFKAKIRGSHPERLRDFALIKPCIGNGSLYTGCFFYILHLVSPFRRSGCPLCRLLITPTDLDRLLCFDDLFKIISYIGKLIAVDHAAYLGGYTMSVNFARYWVKPVYISTVSDFFAFAQFGDFAFEIFHVICLSGFRDFPFPLTFIIIQHSSDNVKCSFD